VEVQIKGEQRTAIKLVVVPRYPDELAPGSTTPTDQPLWP